MTVKYKRNMINKSDRISGNHYLKDMNHLAQHNEPHDRGGN